MKKKIAMLSIVILCCGNAHAIDYTRGLIESCDVTAFQLSLCPPVQLFSSRTEVWGLRLDLLIGYSSVVNGLDIGTEVNQVDELNGAQIGFLNEAKCFSGLQIGFGNIGGFLGPPTIERLRPERDETATFSSGIQIGVMNCVGRDSPMSPDDAPTSSFSGVQVGIGNSADEMKGVQIGTAFNRANRITGLQISVGYNYAKELHGVQIGLINRTGNGPLCDSLGGIPVINAAF